ncbi:MAG: flagellar assembly protein FliH [Microbacteriaceae bacterium]|jgi:flagellar assembly protein FliH|nr:flagellar assembly protein FliH [Microbacteriaceae bacterium]
MSTETGFSRVAFPVLRDGIGSRLAAEARVIGHSAGYSDGLRAAVRELDERRSMLEAEYAELLQNERVKLDRRVAALDAAAAALAQRTVPLLVDAQDALAGAAIDLAEAILGLELATGENSLRSALARALGDVDAELVHTVRLNPDDLAEMDDDVRERTGVRFAPDPTLERGDAVTQFPGGYLDARIGTALERAKAALMGAEL